MTRLDELAPLLGGLSWVAAELFAIEGRWASTMAADAAVVHLATHSRHHGWHASQWADTLPDSVQLGARSHIRPPQPGWVTAAALADDLDHVDPNDPSTPESSDVQRLAFLYRGVVPRLASMIDELDMVLSGPGDSAIAHVVGHVRPDVVADLIGGGRLLEHALAVPGTDEIANSVTTALDQAFRT